MEHRRPHIYAQNLSSLEAAVAQAQLSSNPEAKARHIYREIYACRGPGLESLKVSTRLKPALEELFDFSLPIEIASQEASPTDGAEKLALRCLSDGSLVECVVVPERGRLTLCISTQVGCRQGCSFCQTARMGYRRNLTTEEIVGQVALARIAGHAVSNVVFMGMGEPLDNLDNVLAALEILTDERGMRLSPNKVTVSTVGLLPQLDRLLTATRGSCALSLHSPFDHERTHLIPANARHPLADIVAVLRKHGEHTGRSYMIQYLLIQGFNDTPDHAKKILELFEGINIKINIIPMNELENSPFLRPSVDRIFRFQQALKEQGLVATVRLSKGRDIQAACGQLVAQHRRA